jgi:hypothetical protein
MRTILKLIFEKHIKQGDCIQLTQNVVHLRASVDVVMNFGISKKQRI